MLELYVGLPGSGKTTLLSKFAVDYLKKGYNVYSNVHLNIPGVVYIENDYIGSYQIENGLVLIDEGEIFAEARGFKTFPKAMSDWFMLHRHYHCTVKVFCQRYKGVDVKIRNLAQKLYFVRRAPFGLSRYTPIEYKIVVPDAGERLGEVCEGYRMPSFLERLFSTRFFRRRRYYPYFDSYAAPALPPLPGSTSASIT